MALEVMARQRPHIPRSAVVVGVVLAVVLIFCGIGQQKSAKADSCSITECAARHWGYNMTAMFVVAGFLFAANWNFTSETGFFAYPQNPTSLVISHAHEVWTSNWWPAGTWSVNEATLTRDGQNGQMRTYLGKGADYNPEFDFRNSVWLGGIWTTLTAWEYASAALYPADGASGAFNNTRHQCKKLTPTGAVGC